MAYLILVRHGLTDWNKEGRWHGQANISINDEGRKEARKDAQVIKDIKIDKVYTSSLARTKQTYEVIKHELALSAPMVSEAALNERDYGIYTGKNKWEVKKKLGEEKFLDLRRKWNYPIPEGESLKDVYDRVVPFYQSYIFKDLKKGKNVVIISSGNALRALIKYLDNISDEEIAKKELNFGEVDIYTINHNGKVIKRELRARDLYKENH